MKYLLVIYFNLRVKDIEMVSHRIKNEVRECVIKNNAKDDKKHIQYIKYE